MQQYSLIPDSQTNAGTFPPEVPGSTFSDFSGSVERVVYFNEETGQCVLDVKSDLLKANLLIASRLPSIHPGQAVKARFVLQPDELLQQKGPVLADHLIVLPPQTKRTLKKFLKSDAIPDIGPALATLLAESFPDNLLSLIERHPEKLLQIHGVGRKKQMQILESWQEYKSQTAFEQFLFDQNLPLVWAKKLKPYHGNQSLNYFLKNPYQTVTRHQFDFELVDAFALKEGHATDSKERLRCGLYDILQNHYRQGHCAYPEAKLLEEAQSQLNIELDKIENILEFEILSENLVNENIGEVPCIYLKEIWQLEREVSKKLLAFQFKEPPWGYFNLDKVLNWAQSLLQIQLAPLQKEAIETALSSSLTIITGGPGTGKTTLIRSFVTILQTQFSKFALCSPTGRAAQNLEDATGARAQTIHRLLKYDGSKGLFTYNKHNPLDLDLVLIDEVSMVDLVLMNHLLDALPQHCALILVGDADQIPSVGAGNVLQSMIDSARFSTVRLTDIFRQREQSLIKQNAHRINSGEMPVNAPAGVTSDFHYIPVRNVDETKKVILDLVTKTIPNQYGIRDARQIQILVPLNKGSLGTLQLNDDLQKMMLQQSPSTDIGNGNQGVSGFGQTFKVGDKVMVTRNDYKKDVFNGDIGFIERIDHYSQFIEIQFEQRSVQFAFDELDQLTLAYAISIHKSQGSEYRAVIVVVTGEHLPMAQRHLIYTAVTRGKEQVFLVADPVALQSAVLSDDHSRRWQKLTELLSAPHDLSYL
jgi:exodeoxyribonuclease V alpha subunit